MEIRATCLIFFMSFVLHIQGDSSIEEMVREAAVSQANNFFAFDFFTSLNKQDNNLISPWSLSTSFAMLYLGAKGETAAEMEKVLYQNKIGLVGDDIHKGFKSINNLLESDGENNTLNSVNSILIQDGMKVVTSFLPMLREVYGATIYDVDFAKGNHDRLLKFINAWTELRTHGKFSEILDKPPSRQTKLILLNTIYFKGMWKKMFDPADTMYMSFYNYGRVPYTVPFMRMTANVSVGYDKLTDTRALELPYTMGDLSILFLMPGNAGKSDYLENSFSVGLLNRILSTMEYNVYEIGVMKFSMKKSYHPKNILMDMGLKNLFSMSDADLSGISESAGLFLGEVIHQVSIDVNEEGTEASGSTALILDSRTSPPKLYLNRPFLFLIRDARTNVILFIGSLTHV